MCVCVCVCVRERERERVCLRERERERGRERERDLSECMKSIREAFEAPFGRLVFRLLYVLVSV